MSNRKNQLSNIFDEAITASSEQALSESPLLQELERYTERYTELKFHQRGGSKIIYLAQDKRTGRRVALAQLPTDASASEIDGFLREARINALLQHPNIVPLYDIGLLDRRPYFCMKFIEGESLAEILKRQKENDQLYPRTVLIDIFLKVCDAMAYAHSQGVLHLDLKPENIRIDRFGDVLVCDWGLARILDSHESVNDTLAPWRIIP